MYIVYFHILKQHFRVKVNCVNFGLTLFQGWLGTWLLGIANYEIITKKDHTHKIIWRYVKSQSQSVYLRTKPYVPCLISCICVLTGHQAAAVHQRRGRGAAACRARGHCACAWVGRQLRPRPRTLAACHRRRTRTEPPRRPGPPHPPINVSWTFITHLLTN